MENVMYQRVGIVFFLCSIFLPIGSARAQDKSLPYYQAGNSLYAQKDYDQALRYYQYAAQLNPNLWQAYQAMGNCYYAKGDKATALTNYQKALDLNPGNPQLSSFVQALQSQISASAMIPAGGASAATPASLAPRGPSGGGNGPELDVMAGGDLILSASNPIPTTLTSGGSGAPGLALGGGYGPGFGVGGGAFFPVDRNFSIGGNAAFYLYGANYNYGSAGTTYGYSYNEAVTETVNQSSLEFLAAAKYRLPDNNGVQPYLLGGIGFALVSYSGSATVIASAGGTSVGVGFAIPSSSFFCPMAEVGGGGQFPAGNNMNFFAEGKLGIVLVGSSNQSVTYSGSVSGTYPYQSTSYALIEFPVNVGLNFNL